MLKKITIKSCGQFEKVEISFHPRLTVLVGPNGSGKTRILDSLWKESLILSKRSTRAEPALYRVADNVSPDVARARLPYVMLNPLPALPAISAAHDRILELVFQQSGTLSCGTHAPRTRVRQARESRPPTSVLAVHNLVDAIAQNNYKIVLIDLPELYLDPDAQRRLLPALLEAFPETQFVVATHSPLVAASVRDSKLVRLIRNEGEEDEKGKKGKSGKGGKVIAQETSLHRQAMAPQEFLREVMDLEVTIPLWAADALADITQRAQMLEFTRGRDGVKAAWAKLKVELEAAGLGRFLGETLKPFIERARK
jgi:hypothetical protein